MASASFFHQDASLHRRMARADQTEIPMRIVIERPVPGI